MVKSDLEDTSRVAGGLASEVGQRIVSAGGAGLVLTLGGGTTYVAKTLSGPGLTQTIELRRNGVRIDGRIHSNRQRRLIDARVGFLREFEDVIRLLPDLIRAARQLQTVALLGRMARHTESEMVSRALAAARSHGLDAGQ